jgi:gluconate 5-dehydrogenase
MSYPPSMTFDSAFNLAGKTAMITGGGTGLGFGMARCLVAAGAKVILVGRRKEPLDKACAALGKSSLALAGDVTALESIPPLVLQAEKLAGPISLLINNAGNHFKKEAVATSDAEFASLMQTHITGAFALTREVARGMLERREGSIIFIASMASLMGVPKVVAYGTAKTACLGLVRNLSAEWGPYGVRVNGIAPGWIHSEMTAKALDDDPPRKAKILGRTPMNRLGEADDIGWAAVYLCSPAAKFVTGVVLPIDGGAAIGF